MATTKQKKAIEIISESIGNKEPKPVGEAMREAGYSESTSKTPQRLTDSKAWQEIMEEFLPDKDLAKAHKELLNATHIEHMVFPLAVTDEEITELLESVNCKPRKFQHGETANHVWFWAKDNNALKNGLDLAYKLKGKYAAEKKSISFEDSIFDEDITEFSIKVVRSESQEPTPETE